MYFLFAITVKLTKLIQLNFVLKLSCKNIFSSYLKSFNNGGKTLSDILSQCRVLIVRKFIFTWLKCFPEEAL